MMNMEIEQYTGILSLISPRENIRRACGTFQ
jgi:hypothetical protein